MKTRLVSEVNLLLSVGFGLYKEEIIILNETALCPSSSSPVLFPDFPPSISTSDRLALVRPPSLALTHPAGLAPVGVESNTMKSIREVG